MSYKTLYRVYRPQKFEDVAGQEHIIKTLKHAVEENKIAHAYLFCGPRGTGKTTIAKLLAKAINCEGEVKPCDECDNCKEIAASQHPDVVEIDAASNNGVDEVRSLIDKVKYAPTNGKYKVYIIDEVHMMSTGAFNALLKTLEEPPAHVVFILATTEPHKILPTIISRCQRFDFTRLTQEEIVKKMKEIVAIEGQKCDDDALELIAKLADGGMRDALSILEQCLAYNDQHLTLKEVNKIYGIVSLDQKIEFLKVLISKDLKTALSMLEEMKQSGIDIKRLTFDLIDILKDIIIYKNTNDTSVLFVLSLPYIHSIVPYISIEDTFSLLDIFVEASEKYSKVMQPAIYFEVAILKMCSIPSSNDTKPLPTVEQKPETVTQKFETVKEDEVIKDIKDEKNQVEDEIIEDVIDDSIQAQEEVKEQDVKEEVPTFEFEKTESVEEISDDIEADMDDIMDILVKADRKILEDIQERWPIIKRYLANLNTAKCASMLCEGSAVAACEGGLIIAFDHQPAVNSVNFYKNYKQLNQFLTEILGKEYKFIALQQERWIEIRSEFIRLKKAEQLPEPRDNIILKHIDSHDLDYVDLNEAQEFAVDLFGDIVEFKED